MLRSLYAYGRNKEQYGIIAAVQVIIDSLQFRFSHLAPSDKSSR